MCKEMPVIPVNKVNKEVDPKRKKWRAGEEERHKGLLTQKKLPKILMLTAFITPGLMNRL
jgi:hypothetical protein